VASAESVVHTRPPLRGTNRSPRLLLLCLTVFLAFLAGGFILDDYFHLERASRPMGAEALNFAIHTEDHGIVLWPHAEPVHLDFLRPATSLSFWIEWRLWAMRAWGYHLDNLLLHLLNLALLLRLARRLGISRTTSYWLAVAWGVSLPAAPAVGWISGRTELLYASLALAGVNAFDTWITGGKRVWLGVALAAVTLAPFAKESGVAAPLLLLIAARLRRLRAPTSVQRTPSPWILAMLFLPAMFYLGLRFGVFHVQPPPPPYLDPLDGPADVLWLAAKPLLYLLSALLALPLSHVAPLAALRQAPVWLAAIAAVTLLLTLPLVRAAGRGTGVLLLAWFGAALLPYLPVLPTSLYLYLPLAGLALLLGMARDASARRRWPTRWLGAWIVAGVAAQLIISGFTWSASRSLARAARQVGGIVRTESPARFVLFDTPVWAYGLPAAVRLANPGSAADTWFINFSPSVRPGRPSTLRWTDGLALDVTPSKGMFFDSPFEQFLLFGGSAADSSGFVRGDAITVRPVPLSERPGRLHLRFRDATDLSRSVMLQFHGWRLVSVPRPVPS